LLANAHKHARVSTVQACLARAADAITLSVVDDGIGFDPTILD
jgi:two-component system NarL family sensor kinase